VAELFDDLPEMARSPEPLLPLYHQYDSWLLDYDRARMAQAFGAQTR
jgi:hypothetical protein